MNPAPLPAFKMEIFAIIIAVATKGSASDIVRGPGYASYKNFSKNPSEQNNMKANKTKFGLHEC